MTIATTIPHERFLGNLLKQLTERGWKLGSGSEGHDLVQRIEKLLELILSGCPADRHAAVKPLPDWLVNTFRGDDGKQPLKSYLKHSEIWHDIFDSMALWLDYNRFQETDIERLQDVFQQRRSELRDNSFYKYLAGQRYVLRDENPVFLRNVPLKAQPLRQRLTMVGTFCVENFGTSALRDFCHGQLTAKQRTSKIPDAFLCYHEAVCGNPLQTNVVVVSGYYTLFFSLHDYMDELRKTTMSRKDLAVLESSSLQELIEYFRATFIKGITVNSPECHYRHDRIRLPKFMESLAMTFWRQKLREHMVQEERECRSRLQDQRLADDQAKGQTQTYYSRLILERITKNSTASLEFTCDAGPTMSGLSCRVGGLKEGFLMLAVETADKDRCEAALEASLVFRFSVPTQLQEHRFYACSCSLRRIKQVSDTVTALLVEPIGDVIPLDRQFPRIAADLLPCESATIQLDITGLPETLEVLSEAKYPVSLVTDPNAPVWLENISAGGACLAFSTEDLQATIEARYASGRSPSGLLHLHRTSSKRNTSDLLLSFRLASLRHGQDVLRAGLQFQAEAARTNSGKLSWWPIKDLGCHELSRIIFAALLRRRD